MPTVDIDPDELRTLTGHDEKGDDELKADVFALGLEYEGETEDGEFQLEFAPDRLDRLSVEGVARSLRYQYGDDRGVYVPSTNDADWTIEVDASVPAERPYVTGAVVRGVDLDEAALESLIQLQEKLHATMGRKRAKGAIGIHDLAMLKGESLEDAAGGAGDSAGAPETTTRTGKAIRYVGVEPDGDRFVPLDSDRELTPAEVLAEHAIGEQYADLVSEYERYPAIYDDVGLFSFPPVINGRRTEVTTDSRELFVEMTGTDQWTIDHMLTIVCYALDARGATIEDVVVEYADDASGEFSGRNLVRPDLATKTKTVTHERVEGTIGVDFDPEAVVDLLERSGLDATTEEVGDDEVAYEVTVPPYRVDVLHPQDVVDDVGRAYGFASLDPRYPDVNTVGGRHGGSRHERAVRNTLVGLGFEDLLNFHLISEAETFARMGLPVPDAPGVDQSAAEAVSVPELTDRANLVADGWDDPDAPLGYAAPATIHEYYSEDYTIVRTWALPSVLMVLENNTHRSYPQDLAEVGLAAHVDDSENTGLAERRTVAGVVARHDASYEDAKSRLAALARSFDVELETPPSEHPTFVDGRVAEVVLDGVSAGVVGEVHPAVLVEHDLEVPVSAFEVRLAALE